MNRSSQTPKKKLSSHYHQCGICTRWIFAPLKLLHPTQSHRFKWIHSGLAWFALADLVNWKQQIILIDISDLFPNNKIGISHRKHISREWDTHRNTLRDIFSSSTISGTSTLFVLWNTSQTWTSWLGRCSPLSPYQPQRTPNTFHSHCSWPLTIVDFVLCVGEREKRVRDRAFCLVQNSTLVPQCFWNFSFW